MSVRTSAIVSLLLCAAVFGQTQVGSFEGKLLDPNTNLVTGTEGSVQMKNTATQAVFTVPISTKGDFNLGGLPAGTYDLSIPMVCCMYGTYTQKGIVIQAGQALKMEIHMPWNINLGTIGDDPVMLMNDMRAKAGKITGPTPRMPDSKPDFSGVWAQVTEPGRPTPFPLKPWAAEIQKKFTETNGSFRQGPAAYCLPQSALQITLPFHFKLIQTPNVMVHITEFLTPGYRQIFMDGRGHPKDWNPAWMGHSIGKWDGDTLVVDSTGFNETAAGVGIHSEKLHVVERFRRPDMGRLEVDIAVDDEDAYTATWKRTVRATLVPQEEILEFVCAENNKDPLHFGGLGYTGR